MMVDFFPLLIVPFLILSFVALCTWYSYRRGWRLSVSFNPQQEDTPIPRTQERDPLQLLPIQFR